MTDSGRPALPGGRRPRPNPGMTGCRRPPSRAGRAKLGGAASQLSESGIRLGSNLDLDSAPPEIVGSTCVLAGAHYGNLTSLGAAAPDPGVVSTRRFGVLQDAALAGGSTRQYRSIVGRAWPGSRGRDYRHTARIRQQRGVREARFGNAQVEPHTERRWRLANPNRPSTTCTNTGTREA